MKIARYSTAVLAALSLALPLMASASVYGNVSGPSVSYGGINSGWGSSAAMQYGGSSGYYGANTMDGIGSMGAGTSASSALYGNMYYQQPTYQTYWCNGYYSYSPCYQQYWPQYYTDPYYSYYYQPTSYSPYQDYYYNYYPYDYNYYGW